MPQVNDFHWMKGSILVFLLVLVYWLKFSSFSNCGSFSKSLNLLKFSPFILV